MSESGLQLPKTVGAAETIVPYTSLRGYLPLMVHLLRDADADLDKRFLAVGGNLHSVVQSGISCPEPKLLTLNMNGQLPVTNSLGNF